MNPNSLEKSYGIYIESHEEMTEQCGSLQCVDEQVVSTAIAIRLTLLILS